MSRFILAVLLSFLISLSAFAEKTVKPELMQSLTIAMDCQSQGQRGITLSKIEYRAKDDWSVWINGQEIQPNHFPLKELIKLAVSPTEVKVKWFDLCLNGVINVTLKPGQTYYIAPAFLLTPDEAGKKSKKPEQP